MQIGKKEFYKNANGLWCTKILNTEFTFPDGMCPTNLDDVAEAIESAYLRGLRDGHLAPDYSKIVEQSAEVAGKEVKKLAAWLDLGVDNTESPT